FLSAVSREFFAYRELLANDLKRPALDVAVQKEFMVTGGSTLEKLDDYIRACDGIVHLIGKATGDPPEEPAVAALLKRYPDFASKLPPLAPYLRDLVEILPRLETTISVSATRLRHTAERLIGRDEDLAR